jgi:xenotropic and polytropic retrovirus receptor 1
MLVGMEDEQDDDEAANSNRQRHGSRGGAESKDLAEGARHWAGKTSSLLTNALSNANTNAQTFTQRILEKTRQRQQKQRAYRKEHDLKLAFSEFYLSLILLQNYQTLNYTGFRKILKKHDKIFKTDRGAEWHKTYVDTAPFNTNKKVDTFITEVENLFTQYLESGDRQRAMKRLRVPPFEEKVIGISR